MHKDKLIKMGILIVSVAMLIGCGRKKNDDEELSTMHYYETEEAQDDADSDDEEEWEDTYATEEDDSYDFDDEEDADEAEDETEDPEADGFGIVLADYHNLTYKTFETNVSDEQIELEIASDLENSKPDPVFFDYGTVEKGDTIIMTYAGVMDGEIMHELTASDVEVHIGADEILEEVEPEIIGMKAGEEKVFEITMPEDHWDENAAGRKATMTVKVSKIAKPAETPELTNEWVKENTEYSSIEQYRESIRDKLAKQVEDDSHQAYIYELTSKVVEDSTVYLNEEELENEVQTTMQVYQIAAKNAGQTIEEYVKENYDTELQDFEDAVTLNAEESLKRDKILEDIIEREQLDDSEEAYEQFMEDQASIYGYESGDDLQTDMDAAGMSNYFDEIFHEMVVGEYLLGISTAE